MVTDNVFSNWYALGFAALFFVIVLLVYNFMIKDNGYPLEDEIEVVLLPYIQSLIIAAFEETFENLDVLEERIEALDKNELAVRVYNLLPETIGHYDVSFVQSILTEDRFIEIFNSAYILAKEHYLTYKGNFSKLFADWE